MFEWKLDSQDENRRWIDKKRRVDSRWIDLSYKDRSIIIVCGAVLSYTKRTQSIICGVGVIPAVPSIDKSAVDDQMVVCHTLGTKM